MDSQKNYITPEGLAKLKAEYGELLHNERPKLVETIAWAASNGDRSENADYIYGKRRLREIDKRLGFLQGKLERAFVVDPKTLSSATVVFGATVTIRDEDESVKTYQIVGEDEFDIKKGRISWKSPLARVLLGKKVDDEFTFQKPDGEQVISVEKIEYK
jgi:transcription elongation factor GreB